MCELRAALIDAPILAFPTETGQYILDTDASNFGLGGVLSQIQNDKERVVAYCSRALRPSQRRYCTTKREMLAVVAMCIQFISYLRGARFTLRTDHKSLVWLHRFKDTEGMLSRTNFYITFIYLTSPFFYHIFLETSHIPFHVNICLALNIEHTSVLVDIHGPSLRTTRPRSSTYSAGNLRSSAPISASWRASLTSHITP